MGAFRKWLIIATTSVIALSVPSARADDNAPATAPPVVGTDQVQQQDENDPFESSNRFFFGVNQVLDDALVRPAAVVYKAVLPDFARDGVRNFLTNLNSPVIFANDLMQGEGDRAGTTMVRFGINSTVGVLGLVDVATDLGYPYHDEDFGQTLAVWGVNDGPYFYFLILGPSSARDFTGFVVDLGLDPLTYVGWGNNYQWVPLSRAVVTLLDVRSRNIETLDEIERTSVDYYASIRSLYRQSREDAIRNGKPSTDLPNFDTTTPGPATPPNKQNPDSQ